ncbi:hypothetical protein ISCGN_030301 [Ixodes scapularis]
MRSLYRGSSRAGHTVCNRPISPVSLTTPPLPQGIEGTLVFLLVRQPRWSSARAGHEESRALPFASCGLKLWLPRACVDRLVRSVYWFVCFLSSSCLCLFGEYARVRIRRIKCTLETRETPK